MSDSIHSRAAEEYEQMIKDGLVEGDYPTYKELTDELARWKAVAQANNDSLVERIKENQALREQIAAEGVVIPIKEWEDSLSEMHGLRAEVERWKANSNQNETTARSYRAEVERLKAGFEAEFNEAWERGKKTP